MTLVLLWECDDCDEVVERGRDGSMSLKTPDGWTIRKDGDVYRHACPSCSRLRRQVGWEQ